MVELADDLLGVFFLIGELLFEVVNFLSDLSVFSLETLNFAVRSVRGHKLLDILLVLVDLSLDAVPLFLQLPELFLILHDSIGPFLNFHLHLFSHLALIQFFDGFFEVGHAFVLEIEFFPESHDFCLDLGVLILDNLPGLHQFLHFGTDGFHFQSQLFVLRFQVLDDFLVLRGL